MRYFNGPKFCGACGKDGLKKEMLTCSVITTEGVTQMKYYRGRCWSCKTYNYPDYWVVRR